MDTQLFAQARMLLERAYTGYSGEVTFVFNNGQIVGIGARDKKDDSPSDFIHSGNGTHFISD